jgi:thiamine pyrophosphate-dependent acetolactate synthase large subunit-like protein
MLRASPRSSKLHAYDCGRLIDRFIPGGVDVIFGLPGNGINGIMEALRKREGAMRFIQIRHEESAASIA